MSKAEVERIWLPFVPWALLATAAFSERRPAGPAAAVVGRAGGLHARGCRDDMVAMVTPPRTSSSSRTTRPFGEVVVRYLERDGLDVAAVGDGESALLASGAFDGPISSCST